MRTRSVVTVLPSKGDTMARCGCSGRTCNCLVQGGQGIDITGSGTADDPYIIVATTDVDISDAIRFVDTTSVNFTVTGSGTATDPWTVTAIAELAVSGLSDVACESPSPNDVLSWDGTNWVCAPVSVEAGAINTADPITGDGTVGAPISFAPTVQSPLTGTGSAADPLGFSKRILTGTHWVDIDGGERLSAQITFPTNYFTDVPRVTAIVQSPNPSSRLAGVSSVTVTGFLITLQKTTGAAGGLLSASWHAIQDPDDMTTGVTPPVMAMSGQAQTFADERVGAADSSTRYFVTCDTSGCYNEGHTIEIPVYYDEDTGEELPFGMVFCGPCGRDISHTMTNEPPTPA